MTDNSGTPILQLRFEFTFSDASDMAHVAAVARAFGREEQQIEPDGSSAAKELGR